MSPHAVAGTASDTKAGKTASNQNRLCENTAAVFDVLDICEAITKTPSPIKRIPIKKSTPGSPDNPATNCNVPRILARHSWYSHKEIDSMNSTKCRVIAVSVLVLAAAWPAEKAGAYGSCRVPNEPGCVGTLGISRDNFSFQMCRTEVDAYSREVQSYIRCLNDEVASEKEDKTRKLNEVVKRFNCYASGGSAC